jgi:hypothetical protein
MARASKPGDVYQISTPKGLAYFQYIRKDDEYGHLIRILPGIFETIPASFCELTQSKELYFIFFPLAAAVSKGIVKHVASEPLPVSAQKPPTMRRPGGRAAGGKVLNWWLRGPNGEEKKVDNLNEEQKRYSLAVIWNDTLLVERICSGWSPENES